MADSDSSEGVLNMSDLDPDERRELEDELRAMAEEGERRLAPGSGMASRMLGALNVTPEDAAVFREYVRSQEPLCVPSTDEELSGVSY